MKELITKTQAIKHMENGGHIFRFPNKVRGDKFFYKIDGGELFCRCNEIGGWHPSVAPLRETDELYISEEDYEYDSYERKVIRKPIPLLNRTETTESEE